MNPFMVSSTSCQLHPLIIPMTKVNLKNINTQVINLDNQPDRMEEVGSFLTEAEVPFSRFSAFRADQSTGTKHSAGIYGCARSHYDLLENAEAPILVLEDDVVPTSYWRTEFDVPDEADAIYLGVSLWGYVPPNMQHSYPYVVQAEQYSSDWKRIYNMCSTHAILYLNEDFIVRVRKVLKDCMDNGWHFDMGMSSIQKDYVVLAPNEPLVYQKDIPNETNFILEARSFL